MGAARLRLRSARPGAGGAGRRPRSRARPAGARPEVSVAHPVAGAFIVLNPYTVVFSGRTSITLLGYAALPWLLLISYHGVRARGRLRDWGPWWWAAGFALILTSTGGGVNAAVVFWMLV